MALDLRAGTRPVAQPTYRLFGSGRRLSIFEIGQAVAAGLHDLEESE